MFNDTALVRASLPSAFLLLLVARVGGSLQSFHLLSSFKVSLRPESWQVVVEPLGCVLLRRNPSHAVQQQLDLRDQTVDV